MGAAEGCHSWTGCISRVSLQRVDLGIDSDGKIVEELQVVLHCVKVGSAMNSSTTSLEYPYG